MAPKVIATCRSKGTIDIYKFGPKPLCGKALREQCMKDLSTDEHVAQEERRHMSSAEADIRRALKYEKIRIELGYPPMRPGRVIRIR